MLGVRCSLFVVVFVCSSFVVDCCLFVGRCFCLLLFGVLLMICLLLPLNIDVVVVCCLVVVCVLFVVWFVLFVVCLWVVRSVLFVVARCLLLVAW